MNISEMIVQFDHDGEWWSAAVLNVPGALGQGRNIESAFWDAVEAARLLLECVGRDGKGKR